MMDPKTLSRGSRSYWGSCIAGAPSVRLRQMLASNTSLARKLEEMEEKYDSQFKIVFDAIRELMTPREPKKRRIGFLVGERPAPYGKPRNHRTTIIN